MTAAKATLPQVTDQMSPEGTRTRARATKPPPLRCGHPRVEDGRRCRRSAGGGTDHPGEGPCARHDDGSWVKPPFAENPEARQAFIAAVAAAPETKIREIIEPLGYHKRDVTALAAEDSEFEDAYVEARGYDPDAIRNELRKRAFGGSDRLLEFVAKMRLPEGRELQRTRFEGRLEVQAIPYLDLSKLSPERAELLLELLREATPSQDALPAEGRPALELVAGDL